MRVSSVLAAIVVCVSAANAQQPPARPTSPTPAPAPAPARTPARPTEPTPAPRAYIAPDIDWSISGQARLDAERFRYDAETVRAMAQERVRDGQLAAEKAQRVVQDRLSELRYNFENFTPRASLNTTINGDLSRTINSALAGTFNSDLSSSINSAVASTFALAPLAQARWQEEWKQDKDPADSLFNSARDALNRGDWRRSADLFAQVYTKYPKSTRLQQAAYYEAFARYRIGTTDELKSALRVLTERGQGSSNSSNSNEVSILTTRIRGALAQRGDAEAARQLQADAQKGRSCDSEDMQVRSEALSALAQSDMATATPMLRRVLEKKDPCTLELRRRALSILLRRADTAATSAAISVAKNADETIDLRTDAISYLARLPGDNALATLEELLRTSTDRDIQRAAVRSLANTDNSRARQSIRTLIERADVSEQLRAEAISTFERDRGTNAEDAAFLRALYPKLQVDRLKTAAIAAISKNPGTENEQFVLAIARNPNESSDVRSNAISRMYRIPSISIAEIGKLYDAADSRSMRDQIINVLSQRKEPETIDKLGEIVKSSTDPRTKSQAINALSRKDDPRARKLLVEFAAGTP